MDLSVSLQLIVFLPLLAAVIAGLFGRWIGAFASKVLTTGALFAGALLSWPIFFSYLAGGAEAQSVPIFEWIRSGDFQVSWTLWVDSLTAVMLVVITTVSALVHLYSWGYMEEDPSQPRFFAYLSLFSFAMLMLVTADNLVQMFFGWEGVGLASYLLIGFWYHKPSANSAALKAFVVNRVGDFGFSLGIFGTFLVFGTVSIPVILAAVPDVAGSTIGFAGLRVDTITLLALLLFVGAMGKSAQLGLHTWLPDAMEGPTPVSALIHAATMVTAGVFMVCRLSPMFEASVLASHVVIYVGAATAIFAATIGTAQNDIKRVIAYSTCSQLGFMFFAAGVGAYGAAMFHLFTHAFFKALLFLGAGSVIHAMHHEQDMRFYGGLRKQIPFTFWMMVIGTLAITGVGVAGVGFAGYHSKDAILEASFAVGSVPGGIAFFLGGLAALLTSFYSWRLIFLTFYGTPRWEQSEHIQHALHGGHEDPAHEHGDSPKDPRMPPAGTGGYRPHESPLSMLVPLGILAFGSIFSGLAFGYYFLDSAAFWNGSIAFDEELAYAMHYVPLWVKLTATFAMLAGLAIAWNNYIRDPAAASAFVGHFPGLYKLVANKYYVDEAYDRIFVRPAIWLGSFFWRRGDEGTIDRFGPHGAAVAVGFGNRLTARLQSGYLYSYAFVMLLGLVAAATWAIWWVR